MTKIPDTMANKKGTNKTSRTKLPASSKVPIKNSNAVVTTQTDSGNHVHAPFDVPIRCINTEANNNSVVDDSVVPHAHVAEIFKTMAPRASAIKCDKCGKSVSKPAVPLQCNTCEDYFHPSCVGVTPEALDIIERCADAGVRWSCPPCNRILDRLLSRIVKLEKSIVALEEGRASDQTKFDSIEKRLLELESKKPAWADVAARATVANASSCATIVKRTVTEISSREERESNIVISGLIESKAGTSEERQDEDRKNALITLKSIDTKVNAENIRCIFRTGKKRDDNARLTIVKLNSPELRNNILKNVRHSTIPNGCKVRPDLTKVEREDEDAFFKRLAEVKAEKPDKDFRVVGPPGHRRYIEIRREASAPKP